MSLRIAIVGGGLGGLAAALFLRQAGIDAQVYEQSRTLREAGAGIVVPPNMVRALAELGLAESLPSFAVQLEAAWEFRRWQDGRVLFSQPMGEACLQMYGAHCYVAHRGELLALYQRSLPAAQVHLDRRLVALRTTGETTGGTTDDEVELDFAARDGSTHTVRVDAVIGADGIHSLMREQLAPAADSRFSGLCAYRCLVPAEQAPAMARRAVQSLWLGPGRHLVHYPVSGGRLVNIVAIVPAGDWRTESWVAEGDVADLRREFEGWAAPVQQLLASASQTQRWALYDRSPLERWSQGRVTLLGDAAHAMLPFFAQGAAQATEDAAVLAHCLRGVAREAVPQALARYEAARRPRASQVQLMSRGREIRNHLPDGPEQAQRDAEFASGDPLRQSAWLYGHDWRAALEAAAPV